MPPRGRHCQRAALHSHAQRTRPFRRFHDRVAWMRRVRPSYTSSLPANERRFKSAVASTKNKRLS